MNVFACLGCLLLRLFFFFFCLVVCVWGGGGSVSVCERQRETERERQRETERNRDRETETGRDKDREGRWARENSVNSNSETLFYKDCNLGSVKTVGGGGVRERGGRRGRGAVSGNSSVATVPDS